MAAVTDDPTLIADLVRAGVDAELVGRVASALTASSEIVRQSYDAADHKRAYDREYQRNRRANKAQIANSPEANDAGKSKVAVVRQSYDLHDNRCDLTSLPSSTSSEVQRRKEKKEEQASKRGARMMQGATLADDYLDFALREGFDSASVVKMWAEFVDYWVSVPGQRGVKLDWLATWRNRVRDVKARRGTVNGTPRQNSSGKSVLDAFDRLEQRLAGGDDHASGENGLFRLPPR